MDTYFGYDHIKMGLVDAPKTTFISIMSTTLQHHAFWAKERMCHILKTHEHGVLKIDRVQPKVIH